MSDENSPQPTPISSSSSTRRASFSPGQKISELFGRSPTNNGNGPPFYPSPITTAAANVQAQQRRRMSITSLGLSASPTQSAFAGYRARQDSLSSVTSPSAAIDECAIEDGDAATHESPSSPFARRMSFGARALRDVKAGTGNLGGEGFNWSEEIRSRAERSSSITMAPPPPPREPPPRASVPAAEPPIKETPKNPRVPDHFQERILKGDFYMD